MNVCVVVSCDVYPHGGILQYAYSSFQDPVAPPRTSSIHSARFAPSLHWLVVIALVLGSMLSSIGLVSSHGLAAVAAVQQQDGHSHDELGSMATAHTDGLGHPHHGADHSHEKAHALPGAWLTAAPQLPSWWAMSRPWIEMVAAPRLERPPMV